MIAESELPRATPAAPEQQRKIFRGDTEVLGRNLTHAIIGISLLGIAICFAEARGGLTQIAFAACNALSVFLCVALAFVSNKKRRATRPWLLMAAAFYLVSGFFGVLFSFTQDPAPGLLITFIEIARAFIFLFALPAFSPFSVSDIARTTLRWFYFATFFLTLEALKFAAGKGVGAFNDERLSGQEEDWIHANSIGMYAGLLILTALLGRFPRWVQIFSIAMGGYILMLSQSRGSIASAGVSIMLYTMLHWRDIKFKWVPVVVAPVLMLLFANPETESWMGDVPVVGPISKIIARSQRSDPTSGRLELIGEAMEKVNESPVYGYGFRGGSFDTKTRVTYIENTFVNALLESGMVGGFLYLATILGAWLMFFRKTRRSLRRNTGRKSGFDPGVAEACLIFTTFMFIQGLTERTTIIQNGSAFANVITIFIGCLCYEPIRWTVDVWKNHTRTA
jgi:hypothetical protein